MSSTIYGIFNNDQLKVYDSMRNAFNAGALYSCVINTKSIEPAEWLEHEIVFFNSEQRSILLSYGNWKLTDITFIFKVKQRHYNPLRIKVSDKFGQIDVFEIKEYKGIDILKGINESLKKLSSFNSWDEYNLQIEIESLKYEIEKLKK